MTIKIINLLVAFNEMCLNQYFLHIPSPPFGPRTLISCMSGCSLVEFPYVGHLFELKLNTDRTEKKKHP